MARRFDDTSMGGSGQAFPQTVWTDIRKAKTGHPDRQRDARATLLARYWRPIYSYLRSRGYGNDKAKDLTQGFIEAIVLGRDLVGRADQTKGRFRNYLLTALNRYVIDVARKDKAIVSTAPEAAAPDERMTPEKAFLYEWARSLLGYVLDEVETDCRRRGRTAHWGLFQAKVLSPILQETRPAPMAELCRQYGISDPKQASNMIITVKRRFRAVLKEAVAASVETEAEIADEIRDLMAILADFGAATDATPRK